MLKTDIGQDGFWRLCPGESFVTSIQGTWSSSNMDVVIRLGNLSCSDGTVLGATLFSPAGNSMFNITSGTGFVGFSATTWGYWVQKLCIINADNKTSCYGRLDDYGSFLGESSCPGGTYLAGVRGETYGDHGLGSIGALCRPKCEWG